MNRSEVIASRIKAGLNPEVCEVIDESPGHNRGEETHFKILVVSALFDGKSRVARQRLVYEKIQDLFEQGLHAVTQLTFTPSEWAKTDRESLNASPACQGRGN